MVWTTVLGRRGQTAVRAVSASSPAASAACVDGTSTASKGVSTCRAAANGIKCGFIGLSPLSLFVSVSLSVTICLSVCGNLPNNNFILNHNNPGRFHLSLFCLEVLSKDTRTSSISH